MLLYKSVALLFLSLSLLTSKPHILTPRFYATGGAHAALQERGPQVQGRAHLRPIRQPIVAGHAAAADQEASPAHDLLLAKRHRGSPPGLGKQKSLSLIAVSLSLLSISRQ